MLEYTFSLPRLWAVAITNCVLDALLELPLFVPALRFYYAGLPDRIVTSLIFFGPFVLLAAWLLLMTSAASLHGKKSCWLLITVVPLLGGIFPFCALMWSCIHGECL